ncbi:hypothetical protein C454_03232 [Haloferax gibbonsii ATCC 33959]|uniref:Uncharacterized protein n=1 Tax=Haloferax gibbonsii (strain ATCC 33959 / DSM 4427 / JCM 8863 / NBRC 102184 / NCIMB 2188 / Ma 2.38) TaxID=1227459 RepID=M0HFI8_HALGM|nr:hypothetical protein C454_03232 [Haloferax gibbonsii ATCC 33959]
MVGQRILDNRRNALADLVVGRHEHRTGRVTVRKLGFEDCFEEFVRSLEQDTRPVSGVLLGARGAAVLEVLQEFEAVCDDSVRGAVFKVYDGPNAAVRPLVGRVG